MLSKIPFEKRSVRWIAGSLFWTVIVLFYSAKLPRMGQEASFGDTVRRAMSQWYVWGLLAPVIIAVDRRLPVARDAIGKRVLWHIPLSFVFTAIYVYASTFAGMILDGEAGAFAPSFEILQNSWRGMFHWQILVYWVIIGAYTAYEYYNEFKARQLRAAELERLLAQSRLEALRAQLHPHFLFNALNAISAHVEREPRVARRMIEQLGELLRLSLDHADTQEVPLESELAFLDRYLAIQRARFEDRLEVSMRVDPEALSAMVPTLVLQPLVENAIRHGIAPRTDSGSIRITASRENRWLNLQVEDDGPGLPEKWDLASDTGVGISNTRERLRNLYGPGQHDFTIVSEPGHGVRIDLKLPFHESTKE